MLLDWYTSEVCAELRSLPTAEAARLRTLQNKIGMLYDERVKLHVDRDGDVFFLAEGSSRTDDQRVSRLTTSGKPYPQKTTRVGIDTKQYRQTCVARAVVSPPNVMIRASPSSMSSASSS